MSEYAGRQFVGIDLHRRRSVIVRTTESGELLEATQIVNDVDRLNAVMSRAGEAPDVVLEATYGWYWAVDALQATGGAQVHLAHPLGVKAFEYRRVKNDVRDAIDLADLLRLGRLPEAWIAPPATRELRELVRHRAKLVALRSHCKAEIHAVLAKCGVQVLMSDLFSPGGNDLLDRVPLPGPYAARLQSLRRLIEDLEEEIDLFEKLTRGRLAANPSYTALQQLPGVGPILGAVFLAEVGDISRFHTAPQLACWAGLTPKHHESDAHVHRGRITKQGSRLVLWAAVESVKRLGPTTLVGAHKKQVADRRGKNIGTVAAARKQIEFVFYALRDHHVRALRRPRPVISSQGEARRHAPTAGREVVQVMTPAQRRGRPL
jgi:transposase